MTEKITITGGTGFVGREICRHPALQSCEIQVITRDASAAAELLDQENVRFIEGELTDDRLLDETLAGNKAVIHLIGILNEKGDNGLGFDLVHHQLPRLLANACVRSGVRRFVHMSALNADATAGSSYYLRSKGAGEDAVHALEPQLQVTSFRPSVIFGPDDSFVNRFDQLLKLAPMMPLACPEARFAPVYVGDVAERFVSAIDDASLHGQRIELCGPREYSLIELVKYIAEAAGRSRMIFGLPDLASRMQAGMLEYFPGKPFSLDNYRSLQTDSVCHCEQREPTTLESIVPTYLG